MQLPQLMFAGDNLWLNRWTYAHSRSEATFSDDTAYASIFELDVSIVVQHTHLDSRQAENALLRTIAYANSD